MLTQLDRLLIAVPSAANATETFSDYFGAAAVSESDMPHLGATSTVIGVGDSLIELLQATTSGPVGDFVDQWGGGLFGVGFATGDMGGVADRLTKANAPFTEVEGALYLDAPQLTGLRAVINPASDTPREPVGLLSHIYEVTNVVENAPAVTAYHADQFGLDASKFNAIESGRYGYTGTLTLFNPPERLDRIEVTQITDYDGAMGKFHKARGNGLYMCFAEVDDFAALRANLERAGARIGLDDPNEEGADPDVLFVHPKSLHGMFMGISQTGVAWRWSSGAKYH